MHATCRRSFVSCRHLSATTRSRSRRTYSIHALPSASKTSGLLPLVYSASNLVVSFESSSGVHVYSRQAVTGKDGLSFTLEGEPTLPFFLSEPSSTTDVPVGLVRYTVVEALKNHVDECPLQVVGSRDLSFVSFKPWVNDGGPESRTSHIQRLVKDWKDSSLFTDILRGWSNEDYPVYSLPLPAIGSADLAFSIERAALPLFGFPNYGCLLIAHYHCADTGKTMFWVPRRSRNKRTWPGRLDVTVGGGMATGESATDTIVRECTEEASLDAKFVRDNLRKTGILPFPNRSPAGWILPGFYHLFDLPLPPDGSIRPKINADDGEVESFELMDADTIMRNLLTGQFKGSSAMAFVRFLIQSGQVTEQTEPQFELVCRELMRQAQPYVMTPAPTLSLHP
ncbi:hypothetical protein BV25DRAFT_1881413 [Artomyces pyxidatus]|uniref:Uncharacterized protein n=1 Tax=Artomyces pyxidatus TaxID=48021 RepID=A0ACB8T9R2_9AGAM|nr:hypothetical protein BV25DRAFT_1881413 [Artomyces pyxidatus]